MVITIEFAAVQAWLGGALTALGAAWAGWAAATLRGAGNPLAPGATPAVLVDHGPYRFGRHPMLLGATLMLLGLAFWLGTPLFAVAAGVFAGTAQLLWIPAEEARLRAAFGGWYSDYMSDVRAWL